MPSKSTPTILEVYGMEGLRIADASVVPRVATGNRQAACEVIGECAAQMARAEHKA